MLDGLIELPASRWFLISLGLAVFAIFCFKRAGLVSVTSRILGAATVILVGLYSVLYYTMNELTGRGFDESVLYHLERGMGGAGFADFWQLALLTTILIAVSIGLGLWIFKWKTGPTRPVPSFAAYLLLVAAVFVHPLTADLYRLDLIPTEPVNAEQVTLEFHEAYADPVGLPELTFGKNIVFVYAESLERTYFDEQKFPGVVRHLRDWEEQAIAFTNIQHARGTGWTMGGIVSSQCGIPLVTMGSRRGVALSASSEFLPGARCLGDVLADAGYDLTYFGGASLEFVGKGRYFESHGFADVIGKEKIVAQSGADLPLTGWGVYDDRLLELAYEKFIEKAESESQSPFGIFLLTLDTHHPYGSPSPECKADEDVLVGGNKILDAVRCSDWLLARFIEKIYESEYGKDTVVVVVSDHLAMPNTAIDDLESLDRTNMFFVIDPDSPAESHDVVGTSYDITPTLLSILSSQPVEAFGLGRNLREVASLSSLDDSFARTAYRRFTVPIRDFWLMPNLSEELIVEVEKQELRFGHRIYKLPVLMSLDDSETVQGTYFQAIKGEHPVSFTEHEKPTIAVDRCRYFDSLDGANEQLPKYVLNDFCLYVQADDQSKGSMRHLTEQSENVSADVLRLIRGEETQGFIEATIDHRGLLYSSSDLYKQSGIYAGATTRFGRGLTVSGILEQRVEKIKTIDTCSLNPASEMSDLVPAIMREHQSEFDFVSVSVHHTASCGDDRRSALFAELPLQAPGHEIPYIGIMRNGETVLEIMGPTGEDVYVPIANLYE